MRSQLLPDDELCSAYRESARCPHVQQSDVAGVDRVQRQPFSGYPCDRLRF